MASDSFLSLKVSDLEILSYENAETWFTKMQAVLDGKEIWYPVQDRRGDPPSEEMMIVVLLKGLLPKYETFRQTLMLQDLSFNQAVESLKTAESTLPTTAAEAPSYTNFANCTKERIKCYGCGKYGYV
ncbi:hypothetical protein BDW71DRAFT_179384 [Aspergillus fruticulosus]